MRHLIFGQESDQFPVAILIKSAAFSKAELSNAYVSPFTKAGISRDDVIGFTVAYDPVGKAPVKLIRNYLANLMPALKHLGTKFIYCADAAYFKTLTKVKKAEPNLGYVLPCALEGFEDIKVVLGVNYKSLIYNPENESKLMLSIETLINAVNGDDKPLGSDIVHFAEYPTEPEEIDHWLEQLLDKPQLTVDIETFSLRFNEAGIGSITFSWNEHEGIAFLCDYVPFTEEHSYLDKLEILQIAPESNEKDTLESYLKRCQSIADQYHGYQKINPELRLRLRNFFESYQGKAIYHNSPFDTKVLIYCLWMNDLLDNEGLLTGLHTLYRDIEDTKIIAYLALNSVAGNNLSLKDLAQDFAGNWAEDDIKDIRKIPHDKLLEYNLIDGLATNYVYKKYKPVMSEAQQEQLYYDLMIPSQKVITQIELSGMPMDREEVVIAKSELEAKLAAELEVFKNKPIIDELEDRLTHDAWQKDYEDRKGKAKNPDKILPKDKATFPRVKFNPNSNPQLQRLLYVNMGLPVIDKTKAKQPATGADTIEKVINHCTVEEHKEILNALINYGKVAKILSSFIPAFESALEKPDGHHYLHGSFNLGGTVSGRLSSSDPNLQNIPSGSTYGKLIKKCFAAPKGWLFGGADFNSLEDYISALTTKDPQKLKVYLEGYDGHCLRAFSYFPDRLPDIENTVESINSIKSKYPEVRQDSKGPTFALTYQGTWITLHKNLGFPEDVAKQIEKNYHELYQVSDQWVQKKLDEAAKTGFVEVAFGLRVRTPLLAQTMRGRTKVPYEAEAEGRTAGNALGQSYGLLTNRACNEFMQKVWDSPYCNDIKPVAMIHDAIYLMFKNDIDVVEWVNKELIKSMEWQELPEIQHDSVKIGAALDIFYPNWANDITLPVGANQKQIREACS